jgi:predicted nucleic acid-binding protein
MQPARFASEFGFRQELPLLAYSVENSPIAPALRHAVRAYATPEAVAILDDLAGRRCAEALNIPINGTLGLVLIAKRRGVIRASRPVLEKLRQSGMYLSDQIMNQALGLIGE